MILNIIFIIIGFILLMKGADYLIKGSSSISKKFGVPSIIIGLTIVAFGTSLPELIVNIFSAFRGNTDLAVGNIVGSNIVNILIILGVSAVIMNLKVLENTTWKEIPFAFLAVLVLLFMSLDIFFNNATENIISRGDGIIFISFFIIFLYYIFNFYINNKKKSVEDETKIYSNFMSSFFIIIGLLALYFGGKVLVENAVSLAKLAGLSEALIGLTIIAIGTSLPELFTSIIAVKKGQNDIAIGNVIGSNIFNIFWILGITSIIKPLPISNNLFFDIYFSIIVTFLLFIFIFIGKKHQIERWQGFLFIVLYIAYVIYILLRG